MTPQPQPGERLRLGDDHSAALGTSKWQATHGYKFGSTPPARPLGSPDATTGHTKTTERPCCLTARRPKAFDHGLSDITRGKRRGVLVMPYGLTLDVVVRARPVVS